jgi:hypothetical protein
MTENCKFRRAIIIIRILQHFPMKLWNITNFVMLFQAVMKFLSRPKFSLQCKWSNVFLQGWIAGSILAGGPILDSCGSYFLVCFILQGKDSWQNSLKPLPNKRFPPSFFSTMDPQEMVHGNLVPRAFVWGRGARRESPGLGRSILHSDCTACSKTWTGLISKTWTGPD